MRQPSGTASSFSLNECTVTETPAARGGYTTLPAPVPHRQFVLTIPKRLRASCLYRRRLLGEIAHVAARSVTTAIRTLAGERDLAVGLVACLQTHGSRANWHPHLHLLVTDGGLGR